MCRGDHIVPNFEEIWPSGRKKKEGARMSDGRGVDHVMQAMKEGLPGSKDQKFTTVGKPKVRISLNGNQRLNPNSTIIK